MVLALEGKKKRHTYLETHTIIHIYSHIITESFNLRAQLNSVLFKKGD